VTGLDRLSGVHDLVLDPGRDGGSRVRCEVDSGQLGQLLSELVPAGVRTLVSQPPTLEELFLRHYSRDDGPLAADGHDGPAGP
jgi:polyether ionophore transport system ATP-binding protein